MHSPILKTSFLFSFLVPALTQQTPSKEKVNCTTFNWDGDPAYILKSKPVRISGAKLCDNDRNRTCPLTAQGDERFTFSYNSTNFSILDPVPMVQEALADADMPAPAFNESIIAAIDQTLILEPGQAAYMNFTAYQFCYAGTVSDCTGSLEDGLGVEFCAPLWMDDSDPVISGEHTLVNISWENVNKYNDPYQNQVSGEGDDSAAGRRTAVLSAGSAGLAVVAAIMAMA